MRSLLISLVIILTAPSLLPAEIRAQNRARKSSRELVGLVGPVRSFHMDKEVQGDAAGEIPRIPVQVMAFDEKGNTVQQTMHNPDGSLKWRLGWDHLYDAAGREVKTYYYNEKGVLTNTGVSDYDEKGRLIETKQINPNGSINHIQAYFYGDQGNKIRETHRNSDGSARNNIIRTYDAKGRLTEEVFYGGDGAFLQKSVFTYDGRGNTVALLVFGNDGWQIFNTSHSYDQQGLVKETINYARDGSVRSKESFTYEFDNRGNWIKRITSREMFKEGRSQIESEIVHRTITYF